MITYSEADYIVREIGNIIRYRHWVSQYDTELRELDSQILHLTEPVSPNGKVSIGEAKGNGVHDWTQDLHALVERREAILNDRNHFADCLKRAERYQKQLQTAEEEKAFIDEYFITRNKQTLNEKYGYANAYDRIRRIARNVIRRK